MLSLASTFHVNRYPNMQVGVGSPNLQDAHNKAAPQNIDGKAKQGQTPDASLSPEQIQALTELKKRDREVRAHEQAHLSAAGSFALSGASFTYQQGPDGKQYAIGGEVNIDTSAVAGDPQATLRKAEIIRQAATAPMQPSDQDRKVAAQAAKMATKAQNELLRQNYDRQISSNKPSEFRLGSNVDYSV